MVRQGVRAPAPLLSRAAAPMLLLVLQLSMLGLVADAQTCGLSSDPRPNGYTSVCVQPTVYQAPNPVCQNGGTLTYSSWCTIENRPGFLAVFDCLCTCPRQWAGLFCTEEGAICDGANACLNGGECVGLNKCKCTAQWTGSQCRDAVCAVGCDPIGGQCPGAPGSCFCKGSGPSRFVGALCNQCLPGYWKSDVTGLCEIKQTRGYCDSKDAVAVYNPSRDACDCSEFRWYGERCNVPCEKCGAGQRAVGGCYDTQPVVCTACTECPLGQYHASGCDGGTRDRVCELCTSCREGTFKSGGCRDGGNTLCQVCTTCPAGKFAIGGCDGVVDTECGDCSTECPPGLFPQTPCNPRSDLVCSTCKPCGEGFIQIRECNSTSPAVCIGKIYVNNFPQLEIGKMSSPLKIMLGVATQDTLAVRVTCKGLAVAQEGRTNYNGASDFKDRVQTFDIVFNNNTKEAVFTITPYAQGRNTITFTTTGADKTRFQVIDDLRLPLIGLIPLPPGASTVFDNYGVNPGVFPFGGKTLTLQANPIGPNISFVSTSDWMQKEADRFVACGIISLRLSSTVTIPLTLSGLEVKRGPFAVSTPKSVDCDGRLLSEVELQQLASTSSLPRTFIRSILPSLPDWMQLQVDDGGVSVSSEISDFAAQLLTGAEVVKIPTCGNLPLKPDCHYAVILWGKSSFIFINRQRADIPPPSQSFCIAVDATCYPGDVVYMRIPTSAWPILANLPFKKKLDDAKWIMGETSVGFSLGRNMDARPVSRFWNGDEFFIYETGKMSFWLDTSIKKVLFDFQLGDNIIGLKSELLIKGQAAVGVTEPFKNFDNLFANAWEGFIEGEVDFTISFTILKKTARWRVTARGAALASLDGDSGTQPPTRVNCGPLSNPKGYFVTVLVDMGATGFGNDVLDSAVGAFLGFGKSMQFQMQSFMLYESTRQADGSFKEGMQGFGFRMDIGRICYFPGLCARTQFDLQYSDTSVLGRCDRFADLYSQLPPGKALSIRGSVQNLQVLGFLKLPIDAEVRLVISATEFAYISQTKCIANLFGASVETSFFSGFLPQPFLRYNYLVNMFNVFKAELDVLALLPNFDSKTLLDWESMSLRIRGKFMGDLIVGIEVSVKQLLQRFADEAVRRFEQVQQILLDIRRKVEDMKKQIDRIQDQLEKAKKIFEDAKREVQNWQNKVADARRPLEKAQDEVNALSEKVNNICQIRDCGYICIPGCRLEFRRKRRQSEDLDAIIDAPEAAMTRSRRALQSHPHGLEILERQRRWGIKISIPRLVCSGCMWRIPDIPCHIGNAICMAIRAPLLFLLRAVNAIIAVLLGALRLVEEALEFAKVLLDKAIFVFDVAIGVLEKLKSVFDVVLIALDAANAAVEVVKQAVKAGLEMAARMVTGLFSSILSIPRAEFEILLVGDNGILPLVPRRFAALLELVIFRSVRIVLSIDLDFSDIFAAIKRIAKDIFDRFFGSLFRRRRAIDVAEHDLVDVPVVTLIAEHLGVEMHHVFYEEGKSHGHRNTYTHTIDQANEILRRRRRDANANVDAGGLNQTLIGESSDQLQPPSRKVIFAEKCDVFQDYSAFLFVVTDEIEMRMDEARSFQKMVNDTHKTLADAEDPVAAIPPVNQNAFADDPVMNDLTINFVSGLNMTQLAYNATTADSVVAARNASEIAKNETSTQVTDTETNDYVDFVHQLTAELNSTGVLAPLGCTNVPDCVLLSVQHIVDLFSDLLLPSEHQDVVSMVSRVARAGELLGATNLTLEQAYTEAITLVHFMNETITRHLFCGSVPEITEHPTSLFTVLPGASVTLVCNATGTPEPSYAWYKNNDTVPVANGSVYTIDFVSGRHDGNYHCVASNHLDTAASNISQILVMAGTESELFLRYSFAGANFTREVGNNSQSFRIALSQDLSMLLNIDVKRITQLEVSSTGDVIHSISPPLESNSTEPSVDTTVLLLRQLVRFGNMRVKFGDAGFLYANTTSFKKDFCRVPCLVIGDDPVWGKPCIATEMSCPFGPGSCRFSCPINYIFQAGQSSVCRRSHQFSGYDGQPYCRRLNDPPTAVRLVGEAAIDENNPDGAVVGRIEAIETDSSQVLSYRLLSGADSVRVDPETGEVFVYKVFDFERTKVLNFKVRVSDDDEVPLYSDADLQVVIRDVNERPTKISLSGSLSVSENVAEGSPIGTLSTADPDVGQTFTYTLLDDAEGRFKVVGNALVAGPSPISFEDARTGRFNVSVSVRDSGTPSLSTTGLFGIRILDRNEAPRLSLGCEGPCLQLDESALAGKVLAQLQVQDEDIGQTFTYRFTDRSGGYLRVDSSGGIVLVRDITPEAPKLLTFSVTVADNGIPSMSSNTIQTSFVNLDASTVAPPSTTITTTRSTTTTTTTRTTTTTTSTRVSSSSTTSSRTTSTSSTTTSRGSTTSSSTTSTTAMNTTTTTTTTTTQNHPPTDVVLSQRNIAENAPRGTAVGTLRTTDEDDWNSHTYTLLDSAGGRFQLVEGNKIISNATFDYEAKDGRSFNIRVRSVDNAVPPLSVTRTITLFVTDVNDPPSVSIVCLEDCGDLVRTIKQGASIAEVKVEDADWNQRHDVTFEDLTSQRNFEFKNNLVVLRTPFIAAQKGTVSFRLTVMDNGSPRLSASKTFEFNLIEGEGSSGSSDPNAAGSSSTSKNYIAPVIAGVVLAVLAIVGFVVFFVRARRKNKKVQVDPLAHLEDIKVSNPLNVFGFNVNRWYESGGPEDTST